MSVPRITVGLVVRNGEAHLAAAVGSFLHQTYRDFELVIYDNASTDQTPVIAHQLAAIDPRVRMVRHESDRRALGNLIFAAERAPTPYFCWAAHDDLREPRFLEVLLDLLERHPKVRLACCAVRNIDPDGSLREARRETDSLRTTTGMTSAQRLRMYLREGAGTPFYGLFRTDALRQSLDVLRQDCEIDRVPLLGLDVVFLADVIRRHGLAVSDEPLILFRRGGWSHRLDVYGTLSAYFRHVRGLIRGLARATRDPQHGIVDRCKLWLARAGYLTRFFFSAPMRRMTWHYVTLAMPGVGRFEAWWAARTDPSLRRLSRRYRDRDTPFDLGVFGAGKHTKRRLPAIRRAVGRAARSISIFDDGVVAADGPTCIDGIAVLHPSQISRVRPDVLLVSSDSYEAKLLHRAREVAPAGVAVWCLYDAALEATLDDCSTASTSSMNDSSTATPSGSIEPLGAAG